MGFNSAFKGLKLLKNPGNGRLNNLNDPVLNVLKTVFCWVRYVELFCNKQRTADAFHTLTYLSISIILTSSLWKCNVCS